MSKDCLRTGDKATVHFRFIKTPEYLHCGHKLVFREGRTKAVGTVTKVTGGGAGSYAGGHVAAVTSPIRLCPQLLQAVNTQASKAQQAKMASSRRKEGVLSPEEARPPSPNAAQLQVGQRDKALCSSTFLLPCFHPSPPPLHLQRPALCFRPSICPLPVPASDRMSRLCGEPGKVVVGPGSSVGFVPFRIKAVFIS